MRKLLFVLLLFPCISSYSQSFQQIENQRAFTKLYGYLKYFYPGDEAAKINWDKFAIYGVRKVDACKNPTELKDSLQAMIYPLMPGVKILDASEKITFNKNGVTPTKLNGYETIAWQHSGVGLQKDPRSPFASARTNRPQIWETNPGFGSLSTQLSAAGLEGRDFVFSGKAKMIRGIGNGRLWIQVFIKGKVPGFFNNMEENPIITTEWASFNIKGTIDKEAANLFFGALLLDNGVFAVDNLSIKIKDGDSWREVYQNDFEADQLNKAPSSLIGRDGVTRSVATNSYSFSILEEAGNKYVEMTGKLVAGNDAKANKVLFKAYPQVGEYMEKDLGRGLLVIMPLALYGTRSGTFPAVADTLRASRLIKQINSLRPSDLTAEHLYTRIGNITNTWNVFQHFYPYFDVAKTNWEQDLSQALSEAYKNRTVADFGKTLRKLTAKLKDGHISVSFLGQDSHMPPIAWKWVENQLVITSVLDSSAPVRKGSLVTKINGQDPKTYFAEAEQYISAATKGWLDYRAQTETLKGGENSKILLTLQDHNNAVKDVELSRTLDGQNYRSLLPKQDTLKALSPEVIYISMSNASMKVINAALPALKKSKAIICDLRGYPTNNTDFIKYLMTVKDTSDKWMQIPQIVYPDQETITGYQHESWPVKPDKKTHLKAKIFFLTDGQAISFAESYLSFIAHYKLATIIGQTTAGTNGNVNQITLPGGFFVRFTGLKVFKHDGSQHHGIGIAPDIYVEQTIKGIRENRDEVLERAILEASK